jgi:nicotinamidase-related amidase
MLIKKEETLGLVIDIQDKLFPHIQENERIKNNSIKLIEGLKILNIPIIVTQQYTSGLGETIADIKARLDSFEPIEKLSFSCYKEPKFTAKLKESGKKNVIICGIETHICILQTALDMLSNGYTPVIIADCTSSRKVHDKLHALERMRQSGVVVSTYESVLFELLTVAGTDEFKAISKLVK